MDDIGVPAILSALTLSDGTVLHRFDQPSQMALVDASIILTSFSVGNIGLIFSRPGVLRLWDGSPRSLVGKRRRVSFAGFGEGIYVRVFGSR